MTAQKRRQFTRELKTEAVELVTKQGYTIVEAARSLGIRENMLGPWRKEQLIGAHNAFPGSGHQSADKITLSELMSQAQVGRISRRRIASGNAQTLKLALPFLPLADRSRIAAIKPSSALIISLGEGGLPGTFRSTGMTLSAPPLTA